MLNDLCPQNNVDDIMFLNNKDSFIFILLCCISLKGFFYCLTFVHKKVKFIDSFTKPKPY